MTPKTVMCPVGIDDHRHRIPADVALDLPFDLAITGIRRLLFPGNRVDIGSIDGDREAYSRVPKPLSQPFQEKGEFR